MLLMKNIPRLDVSVCLCVWVCVCVYLQVFVCVGLCAPPVVLFSFKSAGAPSCSCDSSDGHHGSPVKFLTKASSRLKIIRAACLIYTSCIRSLFPGCLERLAKGSQVVAMKHTMGSLCRSRRAGICFVLGFYFSAEFCFNAVTHSL